MPEIVFDIETTGNIKDHNSLRVTVVSVYDYKTSSYRSFEERELGEMWTLFEQSDRLIGYNSLFFDIPILNKYYAGDLSLFPQLDLLKVIKESCGNRFKLNDVARATLQIEKSADGLQAQKWYDEGKIDEIKKYCEQDVKITKELYEFGRKNRMLYYPAISGEIVPFPVDFEPRARAVADSDQKGINLTLPF